VTDAKPQEPLVDRADVGRELAPKVKLVDVAVEPIPPRKRDRFAQPHGERVVLDYKVHGWPVRLRTGSYWLNAEIISVEVGNGDTGQGVTGDVLRAIPLSDARRRVRQIQRRWAEQNPPAWDEVSRLSTEHDWASFAQAYAHVVAQGERSPVTLMARHLGISRNTVAARVRMARDKGLLTKPDPKSLGRLTEQAERILKAHEGD
jgi:hypothetical protein